MISSFVRRASQWLCLCLLACSGVALASPRIINGTPTAGYPAVGTVRSLGSFGNGVLIGPGRVVTSAHLVYDKDPYVLTCTFGEQEYDVVAIAVHPDFSPFDRSHNLAILVLKQPVVDVAPVALLTTAPTVGTTLTLVGFGKGGDADGATGEYGTQRVGTTPLDDLDADELIWLFDNGDEANMGEGDSGAAIFVSDGDGGYLLAGIVSRHLVGNSSLGDTAFGARIDAAVDWLTDFDTLPQTVVYSATERLRILGPGAARTVVWRGYAVLDAQSGELWAVQAYHLGGGWMVNVEALHEGGTVFVTEVPDGKRVLASITQQQLALAPGDGAWRQLVGPVRFPLQGRYYAKHLQGPTLAIDEGLGAFAQGNLTLRFHALYTADAFGVSAEDMAYYLGDLLAAKHHVPSPEPSEASAFAATPAPSAITPANGSTVRVYTVRGNELSRGNGATYRARPYGYLVYQEATGATELLLKGFAGGGSSGTRIDEEFLNLFHFTVNTGGRYRTPLVASDFLFHPYDLFQLTGMTTSGEHPPRHWQGSWNIADTQALSLLSFNARLNRTLTEQAGSDFDGTVDDLATMLGIDLDEE